jgi:hypothetical protein
MRKLILVVAIWMTLALALTTMAFVVDLFVGTWKLNAAMSKVSDLRMLPMIETITYEGTKSGMKVEKEFPIGAYSKSTSKLANLL